MFMHCCQCYATGFDGQAGADPRQERSLIGEQKPHIHIQPVGTFFIFHVVFILSDKQ